MSDDLRRYSKCVVMGMAVWVLASCTTQPRPPGRFREEYSLLTNAMWASLGAEVVVPPSGMQFLCTELIIADLSRLPVTIDPGIVRAIDESRNQHPQIGAADCRAEKNDSPSETRPSVLLIWKPFKTNVGVMNPSNGWFGDKDSPLIVSYEVAGTKKETVNSAPGLLPLLFIVPLQAESFEVDGVDEHPIALRKVLTRMFDNLVNPSVLEP